MGHNNVVSGHPKFTRIPWVDGLSIGPPDLGHHSLVYEYLGLDGHGFRSCIVVCCVFCA